MKTRSLSTGAAFSLLLLLCGNTLRASAAAPMLYPEQGARSIGSITRSDSVDLLHTRIDLDLTQTNLGLISAKATVRFVPRVNNFSTLHFDLLSLTVDSVILADQSLVFTHTGEDLSIELGGTHGPVDTLDVQVYYRGDPVVDASGWGGFYTLTAYQYDLGVAFDAVPHSFGRSWFPCFDNFVERCTFDFFVRAASDRTTFANGTLLSTTDLGGGVHETHWAIAEPIPSYLASVSSTNYVAVRDTFPSVAGHAVPVALVARPQDTTDMKASFVHLRNAFDTYEQWFGPYRWERVGYCLTSNGAMEHPTNISYPDFIADGTLANETTMAHELSHHWFGDLITCRRAEEMYINEGFADFCGWLFTESVYGHAAYSSAIRSAHRILVGTAHIQDNGWFALNDVPQEITYGTHSYQKGADVARTLRSYLGDGLFSEGFQRVLTNNAFSDMSTEELRDSLSTATNTDLSHFFSDWIMQPGWSAFEVDSFSVQQAGSTFPTTVFVQQKLRHADHFYTDVPVTATFEDAGGALWNAPDPVMLGGANTTFNITAPFAPVHVYLNDDERLALATTLDRDTIATPGGMTLLPDMQLVVNTVTTPTPIRVEEFWVAADPEIDQPFAYAVSPDRWWRVKGAFNNGANATAKILIDGRPTSAQCFDPGLVQDAGGLAFSEDSLVLLYRADAHHAWSVRPMTVSFLGSHSDGYARVTFDDLAEGDYTFGWHTSSVGIPALATARPGWSVYPNPAGATFTVDAPSSFDLHGAHLRVIDVKGAVLLEQRITALSSHVELKDIASGSVRVSVIPARGPSVDLGEVIIVR